MFKRRLLIGLLAFGTVAGYASGIASFGWHARACHDRRREHFEQHVSDVCTRSAHRVWQEHQGGVGASRIVTPPAEAASE